MISEIKPKLKYLKGLVILTANDALQSRGDASYPFMQDASFLYVTKINQPGWRVVIDNEARVEYLIAPTISDSHQLFDGSLEWGEARKLSGIENILTSEKGDDLIKKLAKKYDTVSTLGNHPHEDYFNFSVNPAQARLNKQLKAIFKEIKDCRPGISKQRAIKSLDEISSIRRAISASIKGFEDVKAMLSNAKYEYEIEAILNSAFRSTGADGHAYTPIVAANKNACILHYVDNNGPLNKPDGTGGLVLIDAGANWRGYAADITRTYASGVINERQYSIHEAVRKAHAEIINLLKPGISLQAYSDQVDQIMKAAIESLGLLKSDDDYRRYFPHAISHGLGLDVHDSLGGYKKLLPGMVLTVEPGIYIPEEGIGVRIEDDVLITDTGYDNLSAKLSTEL